MVSKTSEKLNVAALLKQAGLRLTPQREGILSYLIDHSHATVDEIYRAVHPAYPSLSVSTVYNTMKHLKENGLVREITFGDTASRFDMTVVPHHHLVCKKCGKLFDFYLSAPPAIILPPGAEGFAIEDFHLEVRGLCEECRTSNDL